MHKPFTFELEPFGAYWHFDDELETKIIVDDYARRHIEDQVNARFSDPEDRKRILAKVKQLLTMAAPSEAVGPYEWYIQLEGLSSGGGIARIALRGNMIRTVLSASERPWGIRYSMRGGAVRKWKG